MRNLHFILFTFFITCSTVESHCLLVAFTSCVYLFTLAHTRLFNFWYSLSYNVCIRVHLKTTGHYGTSPGQCPVCHGAAAEGCATCCPWRSCVCVCWLGHLFDTVWRIRHVCEWQERKTDSSVPVLLCRFRLSTVNELTLLLCTKDPCSHIKLHLYGSWRVGWTMC